MDQLQIIKQNAKGGKPDSSQKGLANEPHCDRANEKQSERTRLNSANRSSLAKPEIHTDICSTEAAQKLSNQSRFSISSHLQQSGPIQRKSLPFICGICQKPFLRSSTFQKHLRDRHSYELLCELFPVVRKSLTQVGHYNTQEYFKQHREVIKQIQNGNTDSFPIPEEFKNRLNKSYVEKAKQKYIDFNVSFLRSKINFYSLPKLNYPSKAQGCLLSQKLMESFRKITLKYVSQFQRYYQVFIKNISLSQLLVVFLYNFSYNIIKYQGTFLNYETVQFFTAILTHFEQWVNKNYEKVFKLHKIFYYHIDAQDNKKYCERERTWHLSTLIRTYFKQVKSQICEISELKFANFILMCFHEFVKLQELET